MARKTRAERKENRQKLKEKIKNAVGKINNAVTGAAFALCPFDECKN